MTNRLERNALVALLLVGVAACGMGTDAEEDGELVGTATSALTNALCQSAEAKGKSFCDGNTIIKCGNTAGQVASTTNCGSAWNSKVCTAGATYGTASCVAPKCGDGRVNRTGETCDDGNTVSGDGCSSTCVREPRCGDGIVDQNEWCDDGNTANGDGCSSTCYWEHTCGNGIVEHGETCDDGNTDQWDGCTNGCYVGYVCGNGIVEGGEYCDDGNRITGDGCSSDCQREGVCGDGSRDYNEECDDGNLVAGDYCTPQCTIPWVTCGEAQCNGWGETWGSYFTNADCTGLEYYRRADWGYATDGSALNPCGPWGNPEPFNGTFLTCGTAETTVTVRSFRADGPTTCVQTDRASRNLTNGAAVDHLVRVYR